MSGLEVFWLALKWLGIGAGLFAIPFVLLAALAACKLSGQISRQEEEERDLENYLAAQLDKEFDAA